MIPDQSVARDSAINVPTLAGAEPPAGRYTARWERYSIEDPLYDWPEDGQSEDDEWLLDREVERPSPV